MSVPSWLVLVLDDALPHLVGVDRDRLAERIIDAIPKDAVVHAIAGSAKAVLGTRNIRDEAGDLAREIGRNATQTVIFALEEA